MIVIFSGFNQRAVIAFLRTLKSNMVDRYAIIAASENDSILDTDYRDKVYYVRKIKQLDCEEIFAVLKELSQKEELLIAPSTEALNRFLLDHREYLKNIGCTVPLVNKALYEQLSDKKTFYDLCNENGLRVPRKLDGEPDSWSVPFVAKPKFYFASNGKQYAPIIIKTNEDKEAFLKDVDYKEFDIQEYVSGRSIYLFYYFYADGAVMRFSQENYCQQPNGKSVLIAEASDFHNTPIADQYEELFKKVNYRGLAMIELRKDGDNYYMIETNPRFWGPSQLCVDSGVNFFEAFLKDYGVIDAVKPANIPGVKYMWRGGFLEEPEKSREVVWFNGGKQRYIDNKSEYIRWDIYNREDTKKIYQSGEN